jgi:DNA-binding response OmpR family regulator
MIAPLHMLVVDDDPGIGDLLNRYFTRQGFDVSRAADGPALHAALARARIDVILLDLGLPGKDGLDLTRELRTDWNGALIIVTGRGESVDRVMGLELGADDYVTKPFDLRELLARVRSVLRRRNVDAAPAPAAGYRFAGFTLEPRTRTLSTDGGDAIELTTGEYKLLLAMVEQPHQVLSRDDLLDRTSGRAAAPFDRAVDVQISRLRRKIEPDPARPTLIKSVRGAGYLFAAEVSRETTS